MKRKILIIVFLMVSGSAIFAQNDKPKTTLNIEGQIGLTTNIQALFFNLGGPTLRFNFPKFAVGGTFFPSLKSEHKASKVLITPVLGVGPQICFLKDKRFILEFPCYYNPSKTTWTIAMGFGYILTKPKK